MIRALLSAVVLVGALGAATAVAQSSDPDAALLDTAEALLRDGEAVAARAVLRRAHERSPSARSAGLLGLAELATGDPIAADTLLRALPSDDRWVRRERERIAAALAEIDRQVGVVVLRGAPSGQEVRVEEDGRSRLVGVTPVLPFRVRPGRVVVRVGAQSRDLAVAAGSRVEVDFGAPASANPFPEPAAAGDVPFPEGPDGSSPSAVPPASAPDAPPNDGGFAFGGPADVSIPAALAERFARGEVADVPTLRGEWQSPDRHRRIALGFTGRGIPSYAQLLHAFDMHDSCCNAARGIVMPYVMGRLSVHPRFALVGRLGVPIVLNGEGDYRSRRGGITYEDEWDRVFGIELDAYAELDTGLFFVDLGVRLRLWFARSNQVVFSSRLPQRGDVVQVGPAVGAVLRPGLWLDRKQRLRLAAEIAGGKNVFEVGGGLELFFF